MSANMDTITDIDMAFELLKRNWIPVLHKYVSIKNISFLFDKIEIYNQFINDNITHINVENRKFFNLNKDFKKEEAKEIDLRNLFISRGTSKQDKIKLKERLESDHRIQSVCIDVANGYREEVFNYIKELRYGLCEDKILMVGNVATKDAVLKYDSLNVDIIKCGIGPGRRCITRSQTGV